MTQTHHSITNIYQQWLDQALIQADPIQSKAIALCQTLQDQLYIWHHNKQMGMLHTIRSFFISLSPPKGLYIYGDVGRGKSMIMDLLYDSTDINEKKRVHFHEFMQDVHTQLYEWRTTNKNNPNAVDPIPAIAAKMCSHITLLCFDEFHITDIADAMIMSRFFTALFNQHVIVVATSNIAPENLYKDGLQRENFLPFIDILSEHVTEYNLDAQTDYRLRHLKSLQSVYHYPANSENNRTLHDHFDELTNRAAPTPTTLTIQGRTLTLDQTHGDIALVTFNQLCQTPLGPADYIAISQHFGTLLIQNIPYFTSENPNEAKRFIILIDQCYEHHVKLICTAADQADQLYQKGKMAFEFERTASRIFEMQSEQYLAKAHITNTDRS